MLPFRDCAFRRADRPAKEILVPLVARHDRLHYVLRQRHPYRMLGLFLPEKKLAVLQCFPPEHHGVRNADTDWASRVQAG